MTPQLIEALTPGQVLYDPSITGLHVRAFANRKDFYLFYRTHQGRQRRPKIGSYGVITLAQAKEMAKRWLAEVTLGGDPSLDRRTDRNEKTLAQLFDLTWDGYWSITVGPDWQKEVRRLFEKDIKPAFGSHRLSEVTPAKVRTWHRGYAATPYVGNRALAVLSRMFAFAEEAELRPQHTNPCSLVTPHEEQSRERFATEDELAKIGSILGREAASHPVAVAFIRVLALTGSRPSGLERMTWGSIERVNGGAAVTFNGKSGTETLILSSQALEIIEALPRSKAHDLVFGIKNPSGFWAKVRREAGCVDLRVRDLRRTFATVGMGDAVPMDTISEVLNHKDAQTTKIYAKLLDRKKAEAAVKISSRMAELMGGLRTKA